MKRNLTKMIACAVSAMLTISLFVVPAYAFAATFEGREDVHIDWDALKQEGADQNRKYAELQNSEEFLQNEEYGKQILERVNALHIPPTLQEKEEVQELRREFDEYYSKYTALYASIGEKPMDYYLTSTLRSKIEQAEKGLEEREKRQESKNLFFSGCSQQQGSKSKAEYQNQDSKSKVEYQNQGSAVSSIALIASVLWSLLYIAQSFMAYGTAYRKTKACGDSGVSLVGWLIVYNLAALIPFLGIYLWNKSKNQ